MYNLTYKNIQQLNPKVSYNPKLNKLRNHVENARNIPPNLANVEIKLSETLLASVKTVAKTKLCQAPNYGHVAADCSIHGALAAIKLITRHQTRVRVSLACGVAFGSIPDVSASNVTFRITGGKRKQPLCCISSIIL